MKLSHIKAILPTLNNVIFKLENGTFVPEHFHVTEVGVVHKKFIDCGGTIRDEVKVNFQLWDADDYEHRLKPKKLLHIIELSENHLDIPDAEIEVEYQGETIGKFDLGFDGESFILQNKSTACLAEDTCGLPKQKKNLSELTQTRNASCTPGGGCC